MPIAPNLGPITNHGDSFDSPQIQEGATLNEDGYGLRVLNGSLLVLDTDSTSTLTGSNLPKVGDEIIKGSGLYVSKLAKRYKWTGQILCDFEAIGIHPDYGSQTDIAFEGAGTVSSEPIESHYNFENIGGTPTSRKNGAQFDPSTNKFLGFSTDTSGSTVTSVGQPLAGVRSYLAPKETNRGYFHISWATAGAVYSALKGAQGSQSASGRWLGVRLVPEWVPPIEGTWLLTSVNAEPIAAQKGGVPRIIKIAFEITASGGAGWNNLIYPNAG